jgi:hypothetical protein
LVTRPGFLVTLYPQSNEVLGFLEKNICSIFDCLKIKY